MSEISIPIGEGRSMIFEDMLDADGELEMAIDNCGELSVWINLDGAKAIINYLSNIFDI